MKKDLSKPKTVMTLCILRKEEDLLMGMKKLRLGAGYYNGYGGKLDKGETLEECIVREVKEECGLNLVEFEKRGVMTFENPDGLNEVHIYEGISWVGDIIETDEMTPVWLKISNLPYNKMWESDKIWHPYFFERIPFEGWLVFDENHKVLDFEMVKIKQKN
ncbi:MAG TPA: NUDIX domain-containing protein [Candidatus Paceibacterota bacterium]|nr:NUDIX domain-containing protein [Candidatus Paceibacterota bacterium]